MNPNIKKNYVHKNIYWDLYNKTKDDCKYYKDIIQSLKAEIKKLSFDDTQSYISYSPNPYKWNNKKNYSELSNREISNSNERCSHIKYNGKQCRQRGAPTQSGGPIINGKCKYHR